MYLMSVIFHFKFMGSLYCPCCTNVAILDFLVNLVICATKNLVIYSFCVPRLFFAEGIYRLQYKCPWPEVIGHIPQATYLCNVLMIKCCMQYNGSCYVAIPYVSTVKKLWQIRQTTAIHVFTRYFHNFHSIVYASMLSQLPVVHQCQKASQFAIIYASTYAYIASHDLQQ